MCLPLAVRHRPTVHIHRGLNAGVAHQLLLDGERRPGFIQPRPVAVPKRVPTNVAADFGRDASLPDVPLLNLLLVIRFPGEGIGEYGGDGLPSCALKFGC